MYHPEVIAREQHALEARTGVRLVRYAPDYSWDVQAHLEPAWSQERGLLRQLTPDEQAFIRNEQLLSSIDFRYWCRYAWIIADGSVGGGLARFEPWEPQQFLIDEIAKLQLEQVEARERGEPVDGVLLAVPKARQEGITMLARLFLMHRLTTNMYTLGFTASLDDERLLKLWERDQRILDNLPWYLRPEVGEPYRQAQHLTFNKLDSSMIYQDLAQRRALAEGEQFLVGHVTEVSLDPYPGQLQGGYFPAIPQSPASLHILESTSRGRNNWWHFFIESANKGRERWKVRFIPWYATTVKYRRKPPADWRPAPLTIKHAEQAEQHSPLYLNRVVRLTPEQMYWWETTREDYNKKGLLTDFLTHYASTLEESFQFSGISIFPFDTIEHYRLGACDPGGVYELVTK